MFDQKLSVYPGSPWSICSGLQVRPRSGSSWRAQWTWSTCSPSFPTTSPSSSWGRKTSPCLQHQVQDPLCLRTRRKEQHLMMFVVLSRSSGSWESWEFSNLPGSKLATESIMDIESLFTEAHFSWVCIFILWRTLSWRGKTTFQNIVEFNEYWRTSYWSESESTNPKCVSKKNAFL